MKADTTQDISDATLFTQIKQGNRFAFKTVYNKYWDRLFQAAYKLLKDEGGAKDVVQDVFFDFWVRSKHNEVYNLGGYLYRAVRFQALKQLRKVQFLDVHEPQFQKIFSTNQAIDQLDLHDLEETIESNLDQLPKKYKEVFKLSRFNNLSNKEIAKKLNLSPRTVDWYLHAVLKHLKSSLPPLALLIVKVFGS